MSWRGTASLHGFLTHYAEALGLTARQRAILASGEMTIEFNDYDWRLNGR